MRRIEAQGVLTALADELGVDGDDGDYGTRVDEKAKRLDKIRAQHDSAHDEAVQWKSLAELLWDFDAYIQDQLTANSEIQACGYQLGRGLAETYWALDPVQATGAQGWAFLLGEARCRELARLVGRLSAYMNTYTAPAIAGSIEIWKNFAGSSELDKKTAQDVLGNQIRRWYELVVLGQDPTTMIKPYDIIKNWRTLGMAVRQFLPQLVATIVGVLFLGAFLVLISVGGGTAVVKTLLAIAAAAGLSVGGVTGALKNSAQGLLTRLRQDSYTELVTLAVTIPPPAMSGIEMRNAMGQRKLTPITQT
jgi:hypothetical protein